MIGGDSPSGLVGVDEGVHPVRHRDRRHRHLPVPPLLAAIGGIASGCVVVPEEAVLLRIIVTIVSILALPPQSDSGGLSPGLGRFAMFQHPALALGSYSRHDWNSSI